MVKIELHQGDITQQNVRAIVNAANRRLLGGGGVDGAIHAAGGPQIMIECDRIRARQGGCPTGEAVITNAGKLNADYVIHTVGPIWNSGRDNESALLANCYHNTLSLAQQYRIESIAIPNISTGVFGFPKQLAAETAIESVNDYVDHTSTTLATLRFVCFDDENYEIYKSLLAFL